MSRLFLSSLSLLLTVGLAGAQPPRVPKNFFQNRQALLKKQEQAAKNNAGVARKILRRMLQTEMSLAFQAREVSVGGDGRSTEQWVKRDPKLGIRRESIKPEGILLIDDRRRQVLVHQKEKRYQESKSQLAEMQKHLQEALRGEGGMLVVELQGTDTIAGRPADVVFVHLGPSGMGPSRRFWVDRETGLRLRMEERAPDSRILSNTYYLSLELSPNFKPDDFVPPPVPAGFRRILDNQKRYKTIEEAARDGVTVRQPTWLPLGFNLRNIMVAKAAHPRTTLFWGNGLTTLSLVSIASPMPPLLVRLLKGAESGIVQPPKGERSYTWKTSEGYCLLIGNLPDDQLKRIADSVK
ncbi:sigma-E factor regulatory protein RseB domain-containing protein [Armatimonas sp.]|uniref:sigma-E factor regulatory protein RseB domain-containing protein n=1 Tax=Armatimonas sp. TaxID=1872638 RepID=UPI00286AF442|nr:sigma-E factor regulatory protein RseB domain-containing protein [Armatimonas sp.]